MFHYLPVASGAVWSFLVDVAPMCSGSMGPSTSRPEATRVRPPRSSISITLDRCRDHQMAADEELHRDHAQSLTRSGALSVGSVTGQMMDGPRSGAVVPHHQPRRTASQRRAEG